MTEWVESSEAENLLLVSHMPLVARLTVSFDSGCNIHGFQTAQMVQLNKTDRIWKLEKSFCQTDLIY